MSISAAPQVMCIRRMCVKARTPQFWRKRSGCRDGLEPRVCKKCRHEETAKAEKPAREITERASLPREIHHSQHASSKICSACNGMAHRVVGKRCKLCRLAAADEPRPEFVLRRFA